MYASASVLAQTQAQNLSVAVLFIAVLVTLLTIIAVYTSQRCVKLTLPAHVESVRKVTRVAERFARRAHLGEQAVFHCQLAVDEACMNIIEHAYAGQNQRGKFEVSLEAKDGEWRIEITDFGIPFDPTNVTRHKDTSIEGAQVGGWGIHFMQSVMDEVTYTAGQDGNRLIMIKRRANGERRLKSER